VIGFSAAEMDFGLKICKTVQGCNQKARFKNASLTFGRSLRLKSRQQNFATESKH